MRVSCVALQISRRIKGGMSLWLAGFPDGALRWGAGPKRPRLKLPPPPWFLQRLAEAGFTSELPQLGALQPLVSAAVALEPQSLVDGILTQFSAEERLLWEWYGRPQHAFSCRISTCVPLSAAAKGSLYMVCQQSRGGRSGLKQVSLQQPLYRSAVPLELDLASRATLAAALPDYDVQHTSSPESRRQRDNIHINTYVRVLYSYICVYISLDVYV